MEEPRNELRVERESNSTFTLFRVSTSMISMPGREKTVSPGSA
jgi:hypothetical protein